LFPFKLVAGVIKMLLKNDNNIAISTKVAKIFLEKQMSQEKLIKINTTDYIVTAVYELPEGNSQIKPDFVYNLLNK
jgi:putative ABC transport system permease protein